MQFKACAIYLSATINIITCDECLLSHKALLPLPSVIVGDVFGFATTSAFKGYLCANTCEVDDNVYGGTMG